MRMSIPALAPTLSLILSLAMMSSRSTNGGTTKPAMLKSKAESGAKTKRVFQIIGRSRTLGAEDGVMKASSASKSPMERVYAVLTEPSSGSTGNTEQCELI